ncbi:hypothetical protein JOD82_001950 [Paenibacillus sp. 1182]|nr:hypothetical protein [Paenibacillus sp. 1182]
MFKITLLDYVAYKLSISVNDFHHCYLCFTNKMHIGYEYDS